MEKLIHFDKQPFIYHGKDEFFFGSEVVVHGAFGDTGFFEDGIYGGGGISVDIDFRKGSVEEFITCGSFFHNSLCLNTAKMCTLVSAIVYTMVYPWTIIFRVDASSQ